MAPKSEPRKKYRCSCLFCEKKFEYYYNLITHMRKHTEERPFNCTTCSKSFKSNGAVQTHKRLVHLKLRNFKCAICKKTFQQKTHLEDHLVTHTKEKPFICDKCGRRYNRRNNLVRHIKGQCRKKPCTCNLCKKRFTNKDDLYTHKNDAYSCRTPFRSSTRSNQIMQNLPNGGNQLEGSSSSSSDSSLTSTGPEDPSFIASNQLRKPSAVCAVDIEDNCGLSTDTSDADLRSQPVKCPICDKMLSRHDSMRRHVSGQHKNMTEERTCPPNILAIVESIQFQRKRHPPAVECSICGKRFSRSDSLRRHMLNKHKDVKEISNDPPPKLADVTEKRKRYVGRAVRKCQKRVKETANMTTDASDLLAESTKDNENLKEFSVFSTGTQEMQNDEHQFKESCQSSQISKTSQSSQNQDGEDVLLEASHCLQNPQKDAPHLEESSQSSQCSSFDSSLTCTDSKDPSKSPIGSNKPKKTDYLTTDRPNPTSNPTPDLESFKEASETMPSVETQNSRNDEHKYEETLQLLQNFRNGENQLKVSTSSSSDSCFTSTGSEDSSKSPIIAAKILSRPLAVGVVDNENNCGLSLDTSETDIPQNLSGPKIVDVSFLTPSLTTNGSSEQERRVDVEVEKPITTGTHNPRNDDHQVEETLHRSQNLQDEEQWMQQFSQLLQNLQNGEDQLQESPQSLQCSSPDSSLTSASETDFRQNSSEQKIVNVFLLTPSVTTNGCNEQERVDVEVEEPITAVVIKH